MASLFDSVGLGNPIFRRDDNDKAPQTTQIELYGADEETLIRLLRSKIKYALAEAGCDEASQATVTALIERNVFSCGVTVHGAVESTGVIGTDVVRSRVEDLVDTSEGRINSNEVVLLILVDREAGAFSKSVGLIKEASLSALNTVGIFPVRVYLARHSPEKPRSKNSRDGFSLAVLNVVNTDIGGPGMIQLLDSEAASLDWERMVVLAEGWNRSNMEWSRDNTVLSRQQPEPVSDIGLPVQQTFTDEAVSQQSILSISQEEPGQEAVQSAVENSAEQNRPDPCHEALDQHEDVAEQGPSEHPAVTEWLAQNPTRPVIRHPSWAHSQGGESLIDLIRSQAAGLDNSDIDRSR